MRIYYDFHIHSALSPCGDEDMTPCNIAGMAKVCGLDAIAVTDHNAAGNCAAAEAAGRELGVTVLSGIELETAEEVHVVLLFPSARQAELCSDEVGSRRLKIANKPEIYGRQLYLNSRDEIVGEESDLLITATDIGVYETPELARRYGGIAFPAHIDRPSHGIIQMLGDVSPDMGFGLAEITANADESFINEWRGKGYGILFNSDAHYLHNINERNANFLEVDELSPEGIIRKLGQR